MSKNDTLRLISENQLKKELSSEALAVFIDETGHENFADKNHPVFGLGGCAIFVDKYREKIKDPWEKMKQNYFDQTHLHASELQPTKSQMEAIGNFFLNNDFFRIAVTIGESTALPENVKSYELLAPTLLKRIAKVAERNIPSEIALIIEDSERTNAMAEKHFHGYEFEASNDSTSSKVKHEGYFLPKDSNEAGLEVADFIIHTAGAQKRKKEEGDEDKRIDYKQIFEEVDEDLVSITNIGNVYLE